MLPPRVLGLLLAVVAALVCPLASEAAPVSFRNEVMAVLARGGCSQGACHGNQNGKNGFKLSLRGQDPQFDFESLTRDTLGRRTDRLSPSDSLVLIKATATVPHEGGKRFGVDSIEYGILRNWIAEGLRADAVDAPRLLRLEISPAKLVLFEPDATTNLKVTAFFSDGESRDVTALSVFDPSNLVARVTPDGRVERQQPGETVILVRFLDKQATAQLAFVPARPGFVWHEPPVSNFIDKHVFTKLKTLRLQPSELCSDSVFLRRAYLDTLGLLPTADEARRFLADTRPDKRSRLIDELVERPEFADLWALKWSDLLRNEEKVLDRKGVAVFHDWIRRCMLDDKPLNEFARELISSRGSTYGSPAANYYRALRDPQTRAEATAQVFLGVRLQCARCHNHPFERWTQADYHSLAAFFCRVDYRILENNRKDNLDKHEFDGEQIVYQTREGEVIHPRTKEVLKPHLLGAATPDLGPDDDRLAVLADWVARPDNPFFARAQLNRVWAHLLGRGIVDPIDDFRASNPAINERLLESLATDFVKHNFSLRHLVRTIMNSRTYQLSAVPNETNRDDETNFSHGQVRSIQAEQLLDALTQVIDVPSRFPGFPAGMRAGQLPGVTLSRDRGRRNTNDSEKFMTAFGKPVRSLSCECERSDDTTLNQAFQLITGAMLNNMLSQSDNRVGRLLATSKTTSEIVEELYYAALSRPPEVKERTRAVELVDRAPDRRAALEDLLWGLVNSKEFLLRQ